MSSRDALSGPAYVSGSVKIAEQYKKDVVGFVTQTDLTIDPGFLRMTPGVNRSSTGDALGQQYNSPTAVVKKCADIIIVGREITEAGTAHWKPAAKNYKTEAWDAYTRRINNP